MYESLIGVPPPPPCAVSYEIMVTSYGIEK